MKPWVAAGAGVLAAEVWTWHRDPDHVLSRICGRHPILTGLAAVSFLLHVNSHRIWRPRHVQ